MCSSILLLHSRTRGFFLNAVILMYSRTQWFEKCGEVHVCMPLATRGHPTALSN